MCSRAMFRLRNICPLTFIGNQAQENQQTCFSEHHHHIYRGRKSKIPIKLLSFFCPDLLLSIPLNTGAPLTFWTIFWVAFLKMGECGLPFEHTASCTIIIVWLFFCTECMPKICFFKNSKLNFCLLMAPQNIVELINPVWKRTPGSTLAERN